MKKLVLVTLLALSFIAINAETTRQWTGIGFSQTNISGDYVKKLEQRDQELPYTVEPFHGFLFSLNRTRYFENNLFLGVTIQLVERGWLLETNNSVKNIRNNNVESHLKFGYSLPILENIIDSIDPFASIGMSSTLNSNHYKVSGMRDDFPISLGLDLFTGRVAVSSSFSFGTQNILKGEDVKYRSSSLNVGVLF